MAVIHQEKCLAVKTHASNSAKGQRRGYWLWVWDEGVAEAVAFDLKAIPHYPKCCHRTGRA